MSEFSMELTGMFPRSEALVAATRDFDRKRVSVKELKRVLEKQQLQVINFQKKIKIKVFSDGLLNWQDHFRPLTDLFTGIEPSTLTRFTDTNTFFRQPRVNGDIKYTGQHLTKYFLGTKKPGQWKATLPAPFYFARLADDRRYHSIKKLTFAYTDALAKLIQKLKDNRYQSFQLLDPYLGYQGATKTELRLIQDTSQRLVQKTRASIGYYVAFSCPREAILALLQTDIEAIGVDFFNTDIKTLPSFGGKKALLAGCLDSRTSLVEDPKTLATFLKEAKKKVKPKDIRATSNIDFQFVPVPIAKQKLINLNKALS